jgi:RNA polymerase sigma-70 factor, ECF subfamily
MNNANPEIPLHGWGQGPWPTRRDEELLGEYVANGNQKAFEELVRRYEVDLYNYLRNYLGNPEAAEDAFQATFLQLHLRCRQFDPSCSLRPWIFTIATNQAIDLLRRSRRHKAVSLNTTMCGHGQTDEDRPMQDLLKSAEADPTERMESTEDQQRIRMSLDKLPSRLKQVLIMIVYQGLMYREAAEAMGVPIGTVKSRVHAAIRRLTKAMEGTRMPSREKQAVS